MGTRNIGQHELIGLEVKVVSSTDGTLVGLQGTIVDETKNTFQVKKENGGKELMIQKRGTIIRVRTEEGEMELDCDRIMFRPEDRIKRVKR